MPASRIGAAAQALAAHRRRLGAVHLAPPRQRHAQRVLLAARGHQVVVGDHRERELAAVGVADVATTAAVTDVIEPVLPCRLSAASCCASGCAACRR